MAPQSEGRRRSVSVEQVGDIAVVAARGNFAGGKETVELEEAVRELQAADNKKLVLDLGGVSYLSSLAIGLLVQLHTNYQKRGGRIVLCELDRRISSLFVLTKLSLVFEVASSRDEAIAVLSL